MKKIKFFFTVFRKSMVDLSYYRKILKAKFSFSLKYLFFLLFLITLVQAALLAGKLLTLVPKSPEFIARAEIVVNELYPKELEVRIKNGRAETNVSQPYFISMDKLTEALKIDIEESGLKNLVVIDTTAGVEGFASYQTMFLLTENSVVFSDNDLPDGYHVYPLSQFQEEFVLNREVYDQFVNRFLPFLVYLPGALIIGAVFLLLLFPFIGAAFSLLGRLLFLIWASFLVWLVAKILKRDLSYGQTYRLSMHGITLSVIVAGLLTLLTIPLRAWLFFLIFFVFMLRVVVSGFEKGTSLV